MSFNRETLPGLFQDVTSTRMLRQPEPQYFYARLVFMAWRQAELALAKEMGLTPERAIAQSGAAGPAFDDMAMILEDTIRGEAITVADELMRGGTGHTVRINRPKFVNSTYTEASRVIAPNQSISTTPVDVQGEQTSLTIKRYGGPYSTAVQPFAIESFDSERALISAVDTISLHLYRDRARWLDTVVMTEFASGSTATLYSNDPASALASDANAFVANFDRPFNFELLTRAEQKLEDAYIPRFGNGMYMCVLTPQQVKQLRNDAKFQRQSVFDPARNPIGNSYVATVGGIEIYKSATNKTDSTTVSGVTINYGVMFGPGMVGYAPTAKGCRVQVSSDDNYEETVKAIWLAREGHGALDSRFGVQMRTD